METMCITTGFAWKPEARTHTKCVQLLIRKAEDIYKDDFAVDHDREVHDVAVQNDTFSVYNLEQWNTDGGSFCVCPALQPGVYQFVFRVDNGDERELKISDFYDRTFLGNGRAVNYIELTGYSEVGLPTTGRKSRNDRKLTRCTCKYAHLK